MNRIGGWRGLGEFLSQGVCVCFWLQGRKSSDFLQWKREIFRENTVMSQNSNTGNVAQPCKNLVVESETKMSCIEVARSVCLKLCSLASACLPVHPLCV